MGPTPSSFEINMCAKKNCTINEPKMVDFYDAFTNLYKIFFVLSLTLFMVGEQWISGFVWHQNIIGYLISARSYEFFPHLPPSFDFTLSHIQVVVTKNGITDILSHSYTVTELQF